jgi:hypothetical protein
MPFVILIASWLVGQVPVVLAGPATTPRGASSATTASASRRGDGKVSSLTGETRHRAVLWSTHRPVGGPTHRWPAKEVNIEAPGRIGMLCKPLALQRDDNQRHARFPGLRASPSC